MASLPSRSRGGGLRGRSFIMMLVRLRSFPPPSAPPQPACILDGPLPWRDHHITTRIVPPCLDLGVGGGETQGSHRRRQGPLGLGLQYPPRDMAGPRQYANGCQARWSAPKEPRGEGGLSSRVRASAWGGGGPGSKVAGTLTGTVTRPPPLGRYQTLTHKINDVN